MSTQEIKPTVPAVDPAPTVDADAPAPKIDLSTLLIRPATLADMSRKTQITSYYILHSLSEFSTIPPTLESSISSWHHSQRNGYPYLVAELSGPGQKLVVGYAKLREFRSATGGWAPSTELSISLDPAYTRKGIGGALMSALMDVVSGQKGDDWIGRERVEGEQRIRNIIAVMTAERAEDGGDEGEGLAGFYEKWGFRRVGRMEKVGWKFGQWLDTIELQRQFD